MSTVGDFMAFSAASSASDANHQARQARFAAEARLEDGAMFVTLDLYTIKSHGIFLVTEVFHYFGKVSLKNTDIAFLSEKVVLGETVTQIHLEERCRLKRDAYFIHAPMSQIEALLNGQGLKNRQKRKRSE